MAGKQKKSSPKAKSAPGKKDSKAAAKKPVAKKAAPVAKPVKKVESAADKARSKAKEAMKAALKASSNSGSQDADNEEFDPAAFFKASGGKGDFRAHVMRKERVDLNIAVRYRHQGPLVNNAELINLSKGGLCLRGESIAKPKAVLRIEIPLPHTSELFAVQAEVVWCEPAPGVGGKNKPYHIGMKFCAMSLAKQAVINTFIQQRRDELIMTKIGLDQFKDSAPVAGID